MKENIKRPVYLIQGIALEDHFKYHPPKEKSRIVKHDIINKAALDFAKTVCQVTDNEQYIVMAIQFIQQARMVTNQAITFDSLPKRNISVLD